MEPGFERRVFDKNDDPELKWSQAAMNLNVPLSRLRYNISMLVLPKSYAKIIFKMQYG